MADWGLKNTYESQLYRRTEKRKFDMNTNPGIFY